MQRQRGKSFGEAVLGAQRVAFFTVRDTFGDGRGDGADEFFAVAADSENLRIGADVLEGNVGKGHDHPRPRSHWAFALRPLADHDAPSDLVLRLGPKGRLFPRAAVDESIGDGEDGVLCPWNGGGGAIHPEFRQFVVVDEEPSERRKLVGNLEDVEGGVRFEGFRVRDQDRLLVRVLLESVGSVAADADGGANSGDDE